MTETTGREGQKDAYVCSLDEESTGRSLREAMETISLKGDKADPQRALSDPMYVLFAHTLDLAFKAFLLCRSEAIPISGKAGNFPCWLRLPLGPPAGDEFLASRLILRRH